MVESADRSDTNRFPIGAAHMSSPFSTCVASPFLSHRNDGQSLIPFPSGTDRQPYYRWGNLTNRGAPTDYCQDRWGTPLRRGNNQSHPGIRTVPSTQWSPRTCRVIVHADDSSDVARFSHGEARSLGVCQRYCTTGCSGWTPIFLWVTASDLATRCLDVTAGIRTISRGGVGVPKRFTTTG